MPVSIAPCPGGNGLRKEQMGPRERSTRGSVEITCAGSGNAVLAWASRKCRSS